MSEEKGNSTTVLVVDDLSDNLVLMSLALQDEGYRVITAANGEEAVASALVARPDMIIMDIAMPQLDGLGATRQIRKHPELRDVLIVACTAFDTEGFRQAAFDAGFDGFLTKPIDFDRMINLMSMLLNKTNTPAVTVEITQPK